MGQGITPIARQDAASTGALSSAMPPVSEGGSKLEPTGVLARRVPVGAEEASLHPVLLYDADCRLCRFAARAIVRLDRGQVLAVLPLQDPAAEPLLASLTEAQRLTSWRLVRPNGSLAGNGAGLPELLLALPLTRPVGYLLRLVPVGALDAGYRFTARHRGRLGRFVPDGPAPRRPITRP